MTWYIFRGPFNPFECADCGVDTSELIGISEYYMVNWPTWVEAFGMYPGDVLDTNEDYLDEEDCPSGMLCIGCLETRLGRTLERDDFIDFPINTDWEDYRSERLQDRLIRGEKLWEVHAKWERQSEIIHGKCKE